MKRFREKNPGEIQYCIRSIGHPFSGFLEFGIYYATFVVYDEGRSIFSCLSNKRLVKTKTTRIEEDRVCLSFVLGFVSPGRCTKTSVPLPIPSIPVVPLSP